MTNAVVPDTPPMAQQQGITGEVMSQVALDANGTVSRRTSTSRPAALLEQAAIQAAKASTYPPEIDDCDQVAGITSSAPNSRGTRATAQ